MLHMGIILEKDIHDHDSDMSVIPAPSLVSVNPKVDDNNPATRHCLLLGITDSAGMGLPLQ